MTGQSSRVEYSDLRVCLVGDFQGVNDEGMKNVAKYLARAIADYGVEVFRLDISGIDDLETFKRLVQFEPDIVHFVPGVSWKSVVFLRLLKLLTGATTATSAMYFPRPVVGPAVDELPAFSRSLALPDVVFSYSGETRLGEHPTEVIPNGVDTSKFSPLSESERTTARDRFNLGTGFTVLHVGHLKENRNLSLLTELLDPCQVVVAASEHFGDAAGIGSSLEDAGCQVRRGYIPDIEQLYGAVDCYLFPVKENDTIQMPLSILEAMACNLPVVTMDHPGITNWFSEGDGLYIVDSESEFVEKVRHITADPPSVATRKKVERFSWEHIASMVLDTYEGHL